MEDVPYWNTCMSSSLPLYPTFSYLLSFPFPFRFSNALFFFIQPLVFDSRNPFRNPTPLEIRLSKFVIELSASGDKRSPPCGPLSRPVYPQVACPPKCISPPLQGTLPSPSPSPPPHSILSPLSSPFPSSPLSPRHSLIII